MRRGTTWIENWDPDDDRFWAARGRAVARRNLGFSIFAEFLGFSVWLLWSIVVTKLPQAGFELTASQQFWLVSVPALVGATLRFPYTFAVPRFGGRNWTVVSALLLLVPTVLLSIVVQDPGTPFWALLLAAATAGVGGGNFASSMTNISFFYPERCKGAALGLNAAGGNIGVAVVQAFVPFAISAGILGSVLGGPQGAGDVYLQNAGAIWIPLILLSALCAYLFMDNLRVSSSPLREQASVARRKHTWVTSLLYVGSFGSFIGYSSALPLLIAANFPEAGVKLAFLGALVGSVARPFGGWLSDRLGGARVTVATFLTMVVAVLGVIGFLSAQSFAGFLGAFMALFVLTGIGNGSTFRLIPTIFRAEQERKVDARDPGALARAAAIGRREAAAVMGFASAIGAYGGFLIPQGFNLSRSATGGIQTALWVLIGFYFACAGTTWWFYLRRSLAVRRVPSLAEAGAQ